MSEVPPASPIYWESLDFDDLDHAIVKLNQLQTEHDCLVAGIVVHKREVAALRAALERLLDEQNGPPLIRREHEWRAAIDAARAALAREGEK